MLLNKCLNPAARLGTSGIDPACVQLRVWEWRDGRRDAVAVVMWIGVMGVKISKGKNGEATAEKATISDLPSSWETKKVLSTEYDGLSAVDTLYTLNDSKTMT